MADRLGASESTRERQSRVALPILNALYGYRWGTLRADVIAGITIALVSIPQTIGFALIVGIPPQVVIYASIVGVFFTALFSSSRHLVAGPTTSISIILASTIFGLGETFSPVEIVVTLALLIGLLQVTAGLVKLGTLNRFISRSVIVGYTTGVSLLIASGQINNLLGMARSQSTDFFSIVVSVVRNLVDANWNPIATGIGAGTLIFLLLVSRWRPKWPSGLMALLLFGLLVVFFNLEEDVLLIRDIGEILPVLPAFGGGPMTQGLFSLVPHLMSPAIAIAILGMLETVALSKAVATSSGQQVNPNQEIIGLGIGNLMSSIFGTMPGSASFVRTAANLQSGGKTQVAAAMSSLFVAVIVLAFARFANYIPIASLAAMLIFISVRMVNVEQILIAVNSTRSDAFVFVATFLSTIFLRLDTAIYVGVGTSLALFLRKAASPHLVEYGFNESGNLSELSDASARRNDQISIIHVEGELFFGAAEVFQDEIRYVAEDENIRIFILRLKNARHVDATSVVALHQLLDFLRKSDRHLLISGINDEIERVFINSGFMDRIGGENVFHTEENPTMSTKRALLRASHLLQSSSPDIRIFYDRRKSKGEESGPREETGPVDYQI